MATEVSNIKVTLNLDKAQFDKAVGEAERQSKDLDKNVSKDFTSFGKNATKVGAGLTAAVTVPIAAIGKTSVDTFGSVNASIQRAGGFVNATKEEIQLMEDTIIGLGRNTPFSLQQVADAMGNFVGGEISAQEAADELGNVLDFALVAGLDDLQTAVDISATALNTFKDDISDVSQVTDIFAVVASDITTNTGAWARALNESSGAAKTAGLSFEDLNLLIATMVRGGASDIDAVGTAIKSAMKFIQAPTDQAAEALKNVGLNVDGLRSALAGGPIDLINYLGEGFAKANEKGEGFAFLAHVLGDQAAPEFAAAFNLSSDELKETADWMTETEGRGKELSETLRDAISPTDQMNKEWEIMKYQLGEQLAPSMIDLIGEVRKLVDWFSNLDPEAKQMIINIAKIAAVVGPVITVIGGLSIAIGAILSPVGLVISAIALFAVQIAVFIKQFQKALDSAKKFGKGVKAIFDLFTKGDFTGAIGDALGVTEDSALVDKVLSMREAIIGAWEVLTNFFTVTIPQKWGQFKDYLADTWDGIVMLAQNAWDDLKTAFKVGVDTVITFFRNLPANILILIGKVWRVFEDLRLNWINFLTVTVPNFVTGIIDWISKLPGRIEAFARDMWSRFTAWVSRMWNDAKNAVVTGVTNFVNWVATLPGKVANIAKSVWNALVSWVTSMWYNVKNKTIEGVNGVIDWFSKLPGRIWSVANNMWNGAVAGFNSFKDSVTSWASGVIDSIVAFFTDLPARIGDALKNAGKWAWGKITKGASGGDFEFNALGTRQAAGGPTVVGEHGMEVVNLQRGDTVTPNHELMRMLSKSGGEQPVYNINISGAFARSRNELADLMLDGIKAADERLRSSGKKTIMRTM